MSREKESPADDRAGLESGQVRNRIVVNCPPIVKPTTSESPETIEDIERLALEARREYWRAYYQEHREERREASRRAYQKHREKRLEYQRLHQEERRAYRRGYYRKNRKKIALYMKKRFLKLRYGAEAAETMVKKLAGEGAK